MTTMYPGWYGAPPLPPPLGPMPPRRGEAGWTMWPRRIWPIDPLAGCAPANAVRRSHCGCNRNRRCGGRLCSVSAT